MTPTPLSIAVPAQVAPGDWQQWVLIVGGFTLLGYFYLRSRGVRRRDPLSRAPKQVATATDLARHRATERQLESLLVDLEQMSRQISAQLDTRAARLEALLAEADEKIAALDRAAGRGDGNGLNHGSHRPLHGVEVRGVATSPMSLYAAGPPVGPEPSNLAPPPDGVDRTTAKIYAMADEGRPAAQIAHDIHRPQGEVELILALRPR